MAGPKKIFRNLKLEKISTADVEEKDVHILHYATLKSSMTPEEVKDLYTDFEGFIKETKDLDDSIEYIIKKNRSGFEIVKIDNETGEKTKVFKIHNGNVILRSPIERNSVEQGGWLRMYFDKQTEDHKDILVGKCNSLDSAIKLANLGRECGARLMFKEEVLIGLERKYPDIREQLKDLLETDDISMKANRKMKM